MKVPFTIAIIIAVFGARCGSKDQPAPPVKAPQDISIRSKSEVTESDLGLPFYPGSTEDASGTKFMDTAKDTTVLSKRSTKDSPKKVIDFYISKVQHGSRAVVASEGEQGEGHLSDGSLATFLAMRSGPSSTDIQVTIYRRKKR